MLVNILKTCFVEEGNELYQRRDFGFGKHIGDLDTGVGTVG